MAGSRVEEARAAEAAVFAAELLAEANKALAGANEAEVAGEYGRAVDLAARASMRANEALVEARKYRLPFLKRTERLLLEAGTLLDMLRSRGRDLVEAEELATLERELRTLHERLLGDEIVAVYEEAAVVKARLLELEQLIREKT